MDRRPRALVGTPDEPFVIFHRLLADSVAAAGPDDAFGQHDGGAQPADKELTPRRACVEVRRQQQRECRAILSGTLKAALNEGGRSLAAIAVGRIRNEMGEVRKLWFAV